MTNRKNNTPEEILNTIKKSANIITFIDSRFDYDALCSALVMKKFTESIGKKHDLFYCDFLPENAGQIVNVKSIKQETHPNDIDYSKYDLMIYLDSGEKANISKDRDISKIPNDITNINIDHHKQHEFYAKYNYVKDAFSTTENLYELLTFWNVDLNKDYLKLLLLGAITDSNFFTHRYEKGVGANSFKLASEAISKGVNYVEIIDFFNFSVPYEEIKLRKIVYKNTQIDTENKFIYSFVTKEDLQEVALENTRGLSPEADMIKHTAGINFAFVLKEFQEDDMKGFYKLSLRSHDFTFDVEKIAKDVGVTGGGHRLASGAKIKANSIEDAVKKIELSAKKTNPKFY